MVTLLTSYGIINNARMVRKNQFKKYGVPRFEVYDLANQMFVENIVY
ncbi:MAG: hypothetical protein ABIN74_03960 [Ferruginibacter sp.]